MVEHFNDYISIDECFNGCISVWLNVLMTISVWMMYQLWESRQFCGGQTTPGRLSRGACSSFEVEQARQEHLRENNRTMSYPPALKVKKATWPCWRELTEWMLGNKRLRLESFSHAILVFCTNSEDVLGAFMKAGDPHGVGVHEGGHSHPHVGDGVSLLQDVVGDLRPSIILGSTPP